MHQPLVPVLSLLSIYAANDPGSNAQDKTVMPAAAILQMPEATPEAIPLAISFFFNVLEKHKPAALAPYFLACPLKYTAAALQPPITILSIAKLITPLTSQFGAPIHPPLHNSSPLHP